jgi:hypothetical protein
VVAAQGREFGSRRGFRQHSIDGVLTPFEEDYLELAEIFARTLREVRSQGPQVAAAAPTRTARSRSRRTSRTARSASGSSSTGVGGGDDDDGGGGDDDPDGQPAVEGPAAPRAPAAQNPTSDDDLTDAQRAGFNLPTEALCELWARRLIAKGRS